MAIPKKLWISAAVTAVKYSILAVIALHGEPSTNTGIVAKYAALALMDILIDAFKEVGFVLNDLALRLTRMRVSLLHHMLVLSP